MKLKKIISIVLAVSIIAVLFSSVALAEDEKAKVYMKDATVYSVVKDETEIVVPIYVDGEIDMQCFDITVTYDKSALAVVEDKTLIYNEEGDFSYYDANTSTAGEIHFTGVTVDESAKKKSGQIGVLVFTYPKALRRVTTTELGLSIEELGFDTEVSDIEVVPTATLTLDPDEDPNPTEVPTPTPGSIELGDVNEDGQVDASDALAILKHAAKLEFLTGDALIAADVNEDGEIDASDALDVLRFAAHLIDQLGK